MEEAQALVIISGRVQGVYFRAFTRDMALSLKIKGYVRNLPGGQVEAAFAGPRDKVEKAIAWCHEGSPHSAVDKVEVRWEESIGQFAGFDIRY
jgi:acylphosphatase